MKKVASIILVFISLNLKVLAEFSVDFSNSPKITSESMKLTKNGILVGEYGFSSTSMPFNGVYFDPTGNFEFTPKVLGAYKITDLDEDEDNFYATSYMYVNGKQGLFKISKDFSKVENMGFKAALRKVHEYKDKVYVGSANYGSYVVNKDGTNSIQILGDGYYGPFIDDIKSNSKNIYILSRGLLYKVDYYTNQKEQLIFGQRPAFIEVDEDRLYIVASNKFYFLSFDNKLTNEKVFQYNVVYLKRHNNLIIIVETDGTNSYFWFSKDNGNTFYKSNTKISASKTIKNIEVVGDKNYTIYLNLANQGVVKAKLNFDFEDKNIFYPPFYISDSSDLKDKITSFFDHRYPYLGNLLEPDEYKTTTLNFDGKELKEPYMYYSSHDGIDWALPLNTAVYSVSDGVASYFYQEKGLGHAIKITHFNGYTTIYGHLSANNLITKNDLSVSVTAGQKIGEVGMSGNTSGPHLHFTTYLGDKILNNKVDPFGWNGNYTDPWSLIGKNSFYLWNSKSINQSTQLSLNKTNKINFNSLQVDTLNLILSNFAYSIDIENTTPIYDFKNYLYKSNTSYLLKAFDLSNQPFPQTIMGIISYSGFKNGDDKFYSIWKVSDKGVDKQVTSFNQSNNTLSTTFEPNSQYLILKDNYQKISIKNKSLTKQ